MIRIERGGEVRAGVYSFAIPSYRLCGQSRQPLLDGCRMLKQAGAAPEDAVGLFRAGREDFDLATTVGYGASKAVKEDINRGPVFVNYAPFPSLNGGG